LEGFFFFFLTVPDGVTIEFGGVGVSIRRWLK